MFWNEIIVALFILSILIYGVGKGIYDFRKNNIPPHPNFKDDFFWILTDDSVRHHDHDIDGEIDF